MQLPGSQYFERKGVIRPRNLLRGRFVLPVSLYGVWRLRGFRIQTRPNTPLPARKARAPGSGTDAMPPATPAEVSIADGPINGGPVGFCVVKKRLPLLPG